MANLVLVLEATWKGPQHSSRHPTLLRPQQDHRVTTSTGDRSPIFSPERAAPPGAKDDSVVKGRVGGPFV